MHKAIRTQTDNKFEDYSKDTMVSIDPSEDLTRQEHKKDSDINEILRKFSMDGTLRTRGAPMYGEEDYTLDLQLAYEARGQARTAWERLPAAVREHYGTWENMVNAPEGEVLAMIEDERKKKAPPKTEEPEKKENPPEN